MADQSATSIDIADDPIVVGRSSKANARLLHPTISRRHATIRREGPAFVIVDHDSRFGTFINGTLIRTGKATVGDRVQFGTSLVYRVGTAGLQLDKAGQGLDLLAINLDIARHGRLLVQDLNFEIEPDSFVGILAPSGAGKSTLLNCTGGYLMPAAGQLHFNGTRDAFQELSSYQASLGYVTQNDVVFQALTVRENLLFAARLRFGSARGTPELNQAVERALAAVALLRHADSQSGRLSGGQRKRLSVAIELLNRPRLLLLDEPTSGLDPASEANIMEQLRHIARQGTTVLCTTHLMDNLFLFDKLIVLGVRDGVGRLAYCGQAAPLLPHFGCRTFADLYELLENGRFEPIQADAGLHTQRPVLPSAKDNSVSVTGHLETAQKQAAPSAIGWAKTGRFFTQVMASRGLLQALLVSWRSATAQRRDAFLLATIIAQPLVLGGLVCLTQFRPYAEKSVLFFAVIIAIWLGMNNSIRDLVRERWHYLRDRLAGLDPNAYFGSKAFVYGVIGVLQIGLLLLVLAIGRTTVFAEDTAEELNKVSTAWLFLVLTLSYFGGLGLGLAVSARVRTQAAAVAFLPLLIMPQLLLSAVVTGAADIRLNRPRPFRPLYVTVTDAKTAPETSAGRVVDVLSCLFCLSRPAALVALPPRVPGYSRAIWPWDMCHLLLLLLAIWTAAYLLFRRSEARWLKLLDLE